MVFKFIAEFADSVLWLMEIGFKFEEWIWLCNKARRWNRKERSKKKDNGQDKTDIVEIWISVMVIK